MRWLYPFETGHCTETKVTTVMGPRKAANDTDFPSRSWTLKSMILEPSLNSWADKMPADNKSEIARMRFMTLLFIQFEVDCRSLLGVVNAERLRSAGGALVLGLQFVFGVGAESGEMIISVGAAAKRTNLQLFCVLQLNGSVRYRVSGCIRHDPLHRSRVGIFVGVLVLSGQAANQRQCRQKCRKRCEEFHIATVSTLRVTGRLRQRDLHP